MLVDVLSLARDRLNDPVHGVRALLATVPRDAGVPAPPDVVVLTQLEAPTQVLGPVDDALLDEHPGKTLLLVSVPLDVALPVKVGVRASDGAGEGDAVVPVHVRCVPPNGLAPALVGVAMLLTLDCAARALVSPSTTAPQSAQQATRNRTVIKAPLTAHFHPPPEQLAGERYVPGLTVPFPARAPWIKGVA
jgi:hypothetical protein